MDKKTLFETVLTSCGIDFTENDGLYMISYQGSEVEYVQTNGFSLAYSLKRLMDGDTIQKVLR